MQLTTKSYEQPQSHSLQKGKQQHKERQKQDQQEFSCVEFGGGTEPLSLIKGAFSAFRSVDRFGFPLSSARI